MATPMTYDQLKTALVAEGLTVKEVTGSRDRCRCHTGSHAKGGKTVRAWGPINGTMVHITGGALGSRTVEKYIADIINGDAALPDKVQMVTGPDGVVYLNSAGRSNHAGEISEKSLDGAIAANFSTTKTYDDRRGAGVDGNTHFYGIENIAAVTMTAAQRASSVKICAAIARHYGWTGQESVGHGECSSARTKADPNLDLGKFRKDVMAAVKAGTKPTTPTDPEPPVTKPKNTLTILTNNLWGYGKAPSSATQSVRLPQFVAMVKHYMPDLIAVQELSATGSDKKKQAGDTVAKTPYRYVVDELHDLGYAIDTMGSDGRYIFRRKSTVDFIAGKTILMTPEYKGDNKQAALGVYKKGDRTFSLASAHTENEGSDDKYRVGQTNSLLSQNYDFSKGDHDVISRWHIYAGDFNDHDKVLEAFKAKGYVDSFTRAPVAHRIKATVQSFAAYLNVKYGKRIDLICVYKDVTVLSARQITEYADSDHHPQLVTIQL